MGWINTVSRETICTTMNNISRDIKVNIHVMIKEAMYAVEMMVGYFWIGGGWQGK